MSNLQDIARCECRCRQVRVEATIDGNPTGLVSFNHSDLDCNGASNYLIQAPFHREFPVFNLDCTPAPSVSIVPVSRPFTWVFRRWAVETDGDTSYYKGTYLNLALEELGNTVVVRAEFLHGSAGGPDDIEPSLCSSLHNIPEAVRINFPASLDLSAFDPPGTPAGDAKCPIGNVSRIASVFNRIGPASIVLPCVCGPGCGGRMPYRGSDNLYFQTVPYYQILHRLKVAGLGCFELYTSWLWVTSSPDDAVPTYTLLSAHVLVIRLLDGNLPNPRPQGLVLYANRPLLVLPQADAEAFVAKYQSKAEHQRPLCETVPLLCAEYLDRYSKVPPFFKYASGGPLISDPNWMTVSDFYIAEGLRWTLYYTSGQCTQDTRSTDPDGERYRYAGWRGPYPDAYNWSLPLSISPATLSQVDRTACKCVDITTASGEVETESAVGMYLNNATAVIEDCQLVCSYPGLYNSPTPMLVDCFPKRMEIQLPDTLDFSSLLPPCYFDRPFGLETVGSTGIVHRDPALDRTRYTLKAECSSLNIVGIHQDFNTDGFFSGDGAGDMWLMRAEYGIGLAGSPGVLNYKLSLYAGFGPVHIPGEAVGLTRLFTAARLWLRLRTPTNSIFTTYLNAWRLGPEVDWTSYSNAEKDQWCRVENPFSWTHDWDFPQLYLHYIPGWPNGPNYDPGSGCDTGGEGPDDYPEFNSWRCPLSVDPSLWAAGFWRKVAMVGEMGNFCGECDGDPNDEVLDWFSNYCFTHRSNLALPIRLLPGTRAASSVPPNAWNTWITYNAQP